MGDLDLSVGLVATSLEVVSPALHTTGDTADVVVTASYADAQRWVDAHAAWLVVQGEMAAAYEEAVRTEHPHHTEGAVST